jgi:CPA2 family monovalent cation:H+ antiporter-2
MHTLPLLISVAAALGAAFLGGFAARRLGLPAIVGYLVAGMAIGPFTPGYVGDRESIAQLAELGVVLLMFGVGLHFSLRDLWEVRHVAVPGAILQMAAAGAGGFALGRLWGWSVAASIVLGLAVSIASTVVLLRGLMDAALLSTRHGKVAVGWLVLEDLATVAALLLLPALAPAGAASAEPRDGIGLGLGKAAVFVALVLFVGGRLVPRLLMKVARTRSRELFLLGVLALAVGTGLVASELFGVSLALGAFLAGVVVSESPLGHHAGAEILPFREAFAVLFFVSVGMLVDPTVVWRDPLRVLALTGWVVAGKAVIATALAFVVPVSLRTALIVAAGLSQIGEFSFIVGETSLRLGLIEPAQYTLVLWAALLSITVNPFMFRLVAPAEAWLQRSEWVRRRMDRARPAEAERKEVSGHVVVVGYGRVGRHVVEVLGRIGVPRLVVEMDPERVAELEKHAVPVLFGDAANSEILDHAGLKNARALVTTLPDGAASELVVATARQRAPGTPIVARAATADGLKRLARLGAEDVIHPELEGGLEILIRTLLRLGYPARQVHSYADSVRSEQYERGDTAGTEHRLLDRLVRSAPSIDLAWLEVPAESPLAGRSIASAGLRARTGASVVALVRKGQTTLNPEPATVFNPGDQVALIGAPPEIAAAEALFAAG